MVGTTIKRHSRIDTKLCRICDHAKTRRHYKNLRHKDVKRGFLIVHEDADILPFT